MEKTYPIFNFRDGGSAPRELVGGNVKESLKTFYTPISGETSLEVATLLTRKLILETNQARWFRFQVLREDAEAGDVNRGIDEFHNIMAVQHGVEDPDSIFPFHDNAKDIVVRYNDRSAAVERTSELMKFSAHCSSTEFVQLLVYSDTNDIKDIAANISSALSTMFRLGVKEEANRMFVIVYHTDEDNPLYPDQPIPMTQPSGYNSLFIHINIYHRYSRFFESVRNKGLSSKLDTMRILEFFDPKPDLDQYQRDTFLSMMQNGFFRIDPKLYIDGKSPDRIPLKKSIQFSTEIQLNNLRFTDLSTRGPKQDYLRYEGNLKNFRRRILNFCEMYLFTPDGDVNMARIRKDLLSTLKSIGCNANYQSLEGMRNEDIKNELLGLIFGIEEIPDSSVTTFHPIYEEFQCAYKGCSNKGLNEVCEEMKDTKITNENVLTGLSKASNERGEFKISEITGEKSLILSPLDAKEDVKSAWNLVNPMLPRYEYLLNRPNPHLPDDKITSDGIDLQEKPSFFRRFILKMFGASESEMLLAISIAKSMAQIENSFEKARQKNTFNSVEDIILFCKPILSWFGKKIKILSNIPVDKNGNCSENDFSFFKFSSYFLFLALVFDHHDCFQDRLHGDYYGDKAREEYESAGCPFFVPSLIDNKGFWDKFEYMKYFLAICRYESDPDIVISALHSNMGDYKANIFFAKESISTVDVFMDTAQNHFQSFKSETEIMWMAISRGFSAASFISCQSSNFNYEKKDSLIQKNNFYHNIKFSDSGKDRDLPYAYIELSECGIPESIKGFDMCRARTKTGGVCKEKTGKRTHLTDLGYNNPSVLAFLCPFHAQKYYASCFDSTSVQPEVLGMLRENAPGFDVLLYMVGEEFKKNPAKAVQLASSVIKNSILRKCIPKVPIEDLVLSPYTFFESTGSKALLRSYFETMDITVPDVYAKDVKQPAVIITSKRNDMVSDVISSLSKLDKVSKGDPNNPSAFQFMQHLGNGKYEIKLGASNDTTFFFNLRFISASCVLSSGISLSPFFGLAPINVSIVLAPQEPFELIYKLSERFNGFDANNFNSTEHGGPFFGSLSGLLSLPEPYQNSPLFSSDDFTIVPLAQYAQAVEHDFFTEDEKNRMGKIALQEVKTTSLMKRYTNLERAKDGQPAQFAQDDASPPQSPRAPSAPSAPSVPSEQAIANLNKAGEEEGGVAKSDQEL